MQRGSVLALFQHDAINNNNVALKADFNDFSRLSPAPNLWTEKMFS